MKVLAYSNPYPYFIIENFFSEESYHFIKKAALSSVQWEANPKHHDRYGLVSNVEVLRKMIGKDMRQVLQDLLKNRVQRHQGSVPQLRCTQGITNGVPIHTDADCGFNAGVFLHLTEWRSGMGGNLQIWSKNNKHFILENTIQPKPNTLVVLPFSEKSFHSVSPVVKEVERLTLISEWSFV